MYSTILFDLDGTLTDSGLGITNSVAYALEKSGITVPDRRTLYRFIGPPLQDSFMAYCGFDQAQAERAVAYYREYYGAKGIFENALYDGITDLLQSLCGAGKKLLLATSKPEKFAVQVLEYFDIRKYFAYAAGASMDGTRSRKEEVIVYALEAAQVSDREGAVMVGDRSYDILGAEKAGLDAVGVLFGYGSREELEAAGAVYLAEQASDIRTFLLP